MEKPKLCGKSHKLTKYKTIPTQHQGSPQPKLAIQRERSLPPDGLLCNYSLHLCHGQRLLGYDFCIRHILEDKQAPYKQCAYQSQSPTKCPRAAPRTVRGDGYCIEHCKAVLSAHAKVSKKRLSNMSVLMDSLNNLKKSKTDECDNAGQSGSHVNYLQPHSTLTLGQIVLQGSDSEEEEEVKVLDTWDGDSEETESVSEGEDCLKHAGIYTGEEVMKIMRDKLIRLQKLYIDQFGTLNHCLKENRRIYLRQMGEEKAASLMSIHDQPKDGEQLDSYERLRSLSHYHAPAGREALLAAKLRAKRASATSGYRAPQYPSCQHYLTSTTKCGESAVPMAKFCVKHILDESQQVLFKKCGAVTAADEPCETPVAGVFSYSSCVYHTRLLSSTLTSPKSTEHLLETNEYKSHRSVSPKTLASVEIKHNVKSEEVAKPKHVQKSSNIEFTKSKKDDYKNV